MRKAVRQLERQTSHLERTGHEWVSLLLQRGHASHEWAALLHQQDAQHDSNQNSFSTSVSPRQARLDGGNNATPNDSRVASSCPSIAAILAAKSNSEHGRGAALTAALQQMTVRLESFRSLLCTPAPRQAALASLAATGVHS